MLSELRTLPLLIALAWPLGLDAQAILNVERLQAADVHGAHFSFEGSASIRGGNTEVVQLSGVGLTGYRSGRGWLRLLVGAEYLAQHGNGLLSSSFLHLRYTRSWGSRWRSFHFAQLQASESLLLRRRFLLGGGVRTSLLAAGRHRLDLGAGLMVEDERLDEERLSPGEDPAARSFRAANLAVYSWRVREGVELLGVTYVQPKASDPADLRVLADLGLEVKLSSRVGLRTRLETVHDSRPPAGLDPTDYTLGSALTVAVP